jgi:hypothetical protein
MIKMEVVFNLVHLKSDETDEFKINYASLRLKGAAEQWYNAKRKVLVTGTWKQFKRALIERFDPNVKFLDMQLTSLRQDPEESLEDYYTRFGSLMGTVFEEDNATRRMAQLAFVQGMKDKDQRRELIKEEKINVLDQAIDLVISLERHEADFDAPRGLDLFNLLEGPGSRTAGLLLEGPAAGSRTAGSLLPQMWTGLHPRWTSWFSLSSSRRRAGLTDRTLKAAQITQEEDHGRLTEATFAPGTPSSKLAASKNSPFLYFQSWKDHIALLSLGLKTVSTPTSTTLTTTINPTSHIQNTSSHLWSMDTPLMKGAWTGNRDRSTSRQRQRQWTLIRPLGAKSGRKDEKTKSEEKTSSLLPGPALPLPPASLPQDPLGCRQRQESSGKGPLIPRLSTLPAGVPCQDQASGLDRQCLRPYEQGRFSRPPHLDTSLQASLFQFPRQADQRDGYQHPYHSTGARTH